MQVAKWGNSLAVRLPKALVRKLGLRAGDEVKIDARGRDALVVERTPSKAAIVESLRAFRRPLPRNYRFNREEAQARGK